MHRISDSILHLMRGQIFNIQGKTFFTMGGAESRDKKLRVEGKNIWQQELPNDEEYAEALANLEKCGYKVDYVITHCAPTDIECEAELGIYNYNDKLASCLYGYSENRLTEFLREIEKKAAI